MKGHCNFCVTKTRHVIVQITHGVILALVFGLVFGLIVELLWNALLPEIFGWKTITYFQGVGLVILSRLLFGSQGYNKSPQQEEALCKENFVKKAGSTIDHGEIYYEEWWEKEGERSLQTYTKKIMNNHR